MTRLAYVLAVLLVSGSLIGCAAPAIVAGGAVVGVTAADPRTTEILIDDNTITLRIEEAIYTDETLKRNVHVNVHTYNGVVLLTGETPTQIMRDDVVRHAQRTKGVKRIHNETFVAPVSEFKSRRQDVWITTKVKTAFLRETNISSLDFKVVTENQIVYLMGTVTREQGDIAAKVARKVKEIKQIIKLLEYTN